MMACGQQKAKQTAPQGGDDFATKMENTIAQYNALESEAEQLLKGEENDETFDRLVALGRIADSLSKVQIDLLLNMPEETRQSKTPAKYIQKLMYNLDYDR